MSANPLQRADIPGQRSIEAFLRPTGPFEPQAQNPVRVPDLFALLCGITQSPLRYIFRTHGTRTHLVNENAEALFIYRIPPANERERVLPYGAVVQQIIRHVWSHLPCEWADTSKLQIRYSFHPDNPRFKKEMNPNTGEQETFLDYSRNRWGCS